MNPRGGFSSSTTMVTRTASPAPDWVFTGWSGDVAGASLAVNVAMDRNKQVTARFVRTYSLSLRTDGGGMFEMDPPAGPYPDSSTVTLAASPASGWTVSYWLWD